MRFKIILMLAAVSIVCSNAYCVDEALYNQYRPRDGSIFRQVARNHDLPKDSTLINPLDCHSSSSEQLYYFIDEKRTQITVFEYDVARGPFNEVRLNPPFSLQDREIKIYGLTHDDDNSFNGLMVLNLEPNYTTKYNKKGKFEYFDEMWECRFNYAGGEITDCSWLILNYNIFEVDISKYEKINEGLISYSQWTAFIKKRLGGVRIIDTGEVSFDNTLQKSEGMDFSKRFWITAFYDLNPTPVTFNSKGDFQGFIPTLIDKSFREKPKKEWYIQF